MNRKLHPLNAESPDWIAAPIALFLTLLLIGVAFIEAADANLTPAYVPAHTHASVQQGGTISLTTLSGTLSVAKGGTGAIDAATARTNLGAAGLGANTFTGTQSSSKACASGYTRKTPNYCVKDSRMFSGMTRDACTSVALPAGDVKALLVSLRANAYSANSAGQDRSATVDVFTDSGCSTYYGDVSAFAEAREWNALAANIIASQSVSVLVTPVSGYIYLRFSDDAGNQGTGYYAVLGYFD